GDQNLELGLTAIAPLPSGYGVRGCIAASHTARQELSYFTEERLRLLEGFAFRASLAMQRALLYRSQRESAETASALLDSARQLAGATHRVELTNRIVESAGRTLGSWRSSLWLQTTRGECRLEAVWREDGKPHAVPVGTIYPLGQARALIERTQPFL